MGKQSRARAARRARKEHGPIEEMRSALVELPGLVSSGTVDAKLGEELRKRMEAAIRAHDVLGLRGNALSPYVSAAAAAAERALPAPVDLWPLGQWPRVNSVAGMEPLQAVIERFGNDETLLAQLRPIAAAEGVSLKDVVVAKRDTHGVLELAFYAPWRDGGFAPIFSVEYQQ